jgi:BioD-like phosphotransacetylase family protein
MKSILVSSVEGYSGKSAVIIALGLILRERGFKVGYFKPFGVGITRIRGQLVDEDAYNTAIALNTGDDIAERFLERNGMELLGTLPYDPLLAGLFVSEIRDALDGEWLVKPAEDEIIEEFVIGAMSPPSALKYFRRVRQAALITGGDRADLQNLALETGNIKCILLTGHLEPPQTMLGKAEEKGVPVILVADDTLATIEKIDEILGKARIRDDAKIRRIKELVELVVDLERLWGE